MIKLKVITTLLSSVLFPVMSSNVKEASMDTLNAITTLLGNGFFPIMICGVLLWYIYKKEAQTREAMKEMSANHKEEITELRKSIDNNTIVVQKLVDKIGGE